MKKIIFTLSLLFSLSLAVNAQDKISTPEVGDVLLVSAPDGTTYNHVFFPKLNFLVKKGKLANYKSVYNTKVVVENVFEKNGNIYVMLTPEDGSRFFGYLSKVKANFTKSIDSGELHLINTDYKSSKGNGDIASI